MTSARATRAATRLIWSLRRRALPNSSCTASKCALAYLGSDHTPPSKCQNMHGAHTTDTPAHQQQQPTKQNTNKQECEGTDTNTQRMRMHMGIKCVSLLAHSCAAQQKKKRKRKLEQTQNQEQSMLHVSTPRTSALCTLHCSRKSLDQTGTSGRHASGGTAPPPRPMWLTGHWAGRGQRGWPCDRGWCHCNAGTHTRARLFFMTSPPIASIPHTHTAHTHTHTHTHKGIRDECRLWRTAK